MRGRTLSIRESRKARGFTLVELLVVIGIIAVLISILLPALNKARGQAIKTQCLSNLHQMLLASLMYAQNNHDYLPYRTQKILPGWYFPPNYMVATTFDLMDGTRLTKHTDGFIVPYLGSLKAANCPGPLRNLFEDTGHSGYANGTAITYNYFNYKFNSQFGTSVRPDGQPDLTKASRNKGKWPLWGCLTLFNSSPAGGGQAYTYGHQGGVGPITDVSKQHPDGMNAVLMDGSARWYRWDELEPWWCNSTAATPPPNGPASYVPTTTDTTTAPQDGVLTWYWPYTK